MKKQGIFVTIFLAVILIATFVGCSQVAPNPTTAPAATAPTAAAVPQTYNWKMAGLNAAGSPHAVSYEESLPKALTLASKGRINITLYPGGVLGKSQQNLQILTSGAAQLTYMVPGYSADSLPLATVLDLPFMGKDSAQKADVMKKAWTTTSELKTYSDRFGLHYLYAGPGEAVAILTRKPAKNVADLKGLKLRTAGAAQNYLCKAWGAVPVEMSGGDVYQALQTGVVDGALISVSGQEGYKLYEQAPNFLIPNYWMITTEGVGFMRTDVWNSLSKQDQDIITQVCDTLQPSINKDMMNYPEPAIKRMQDKGCIITRMTTAETDSLREISIKSWDAWLKDYPDGQALFNQIKQWLST